MSSLLLSRSYQGPIPVLISYLSIGKISIPIPISILPSIQLSLLRTPCRYASGNLLVKSSVPPSLGAAGTITDDNNFTANISDAHSNTSLSPLKHRNNETPMEYIASIPPIEVNGTTAVCDGGGIPALGHPIEYIQLNKVDPNAPETCKYCGLRFIQKAHH